MKNVICYVTVFLLGSVTFKAWAQDLIQISGEHTPAFYQIDLNNNSSKFNEYRDLRNGFSIHSFKLDIFDPSSGWYLDFDGEKLLRDDQNIIFRLGNFDKRWNIVIDHNETPHRLSNKAMTPFLHQGGGLFTVPAQAAIIKDGIDATGTPSLVPTAAQMAINDALLARYIDAYLLPVSLGTQRNRTKATLNLLGLGKYKFHFTFLNENREGTRKTYGPLGDRPPRTINIQLPEPMEYITREFHANADYIGKRFQVRLNYLLSGFNNKIETLRWENVFFSPDSGSDFISSVPGATRNISNFGQRTLAPDNISHSVSFSAGLDLPLESRLTATAVLGLMKQNMHLLPYSNSTLGGDIAPNNGDGLNWNNIDKLPREKAEAEMQTIRFDVIYTINPISRLNLRPFFSYYKLDNNTPIDQWRYVTQDVAGTNGDVNYRSLRRNLPYAYEKQKFGIDIRHYISYWRTTMGLEYKRESIQRKYRETDTDENIVRASVRTRPTNRLSLKAGYLYGDRKGDGYDYMVISQSYWYSFEQAANEVDNPQYLFGNHPDLRKYDVANRKRNELKLSATYIALDNLDMSASYRLRTDDFDSGVEKIAPLAGTNVPLPNPADANALTPGQQLGLLRDARNNFSVNIQYIPSEKWTISIFADRETTDSDQRGMVYNENSRNKPSKASIQSPTQLGPWTDPERHYTANSLEKSNTFGMGLGYEFIPEKLRLLTDLSLSLSNVDLEYSGYGSDAAYLGRDWETFQFGFNSPATIKYNQHIFNASIEYNLLANLKFGLHYLYNRYVIEDWTQEPSGQWVEQVDSEFLLRDTSRDNRWGNRLISMGSYLAPGYVAHVGFLTMSYRF